MGDLLTIGTLLISFVLCFSILRMQRRLGNLERSLDALLRQLQIAPTAEPGPPSDRVRELAADPKRKTDAIRLYRRETGADSLRAKAVIEALAQIQ
jgi:hypothetical protein